MPFRQAGRHEGRPLRMGWGAVRWMLVGDGFPVPGGAVWRAVEGAGIVVVTLPPAMFGFEIRCALQHPYGC